ncbi:hypothetical protein K443DRAFT_15949 [Laccaria amethystina LaAM-08-1]|uniref:Uncharacterized protein n=1 Tax=Laccaria amethystina LaAM-08-1 TaxID=1095629 RepID=A0A0C9WWE8_9AGAR|nr:hypothetical protein K443DRAFT_15949 [Laccaria amethystina LaAM-08-1]
MDVWDQALQRPDAHTEPGTDCLHWNLPGIFEQWTDQIYHILFLERERKAVVGSFPSSRHFAWSILAACAGFADGDTSSRAANEVLKLWGRKRRRNTLNDDGTRRSLLQIMMEDIHSKTYSLLIDAYIKDPAQREYLFDAIETIPCIKESALRWISNQESTVAERLAAFAAVEDIFFSSSFASIFWMKKRDLPSRTSLSAHEGMHTDFACLLFSHLKRRRRRPHPEVVKHIIVEAVKIDRLRPFAQSQGFRSPRGRYIRKKWSQIFNERLVAFMAVEGIFFSGSFASIFWMDW